MKKLILALMLICCFTSTSYASKDWMYKLFDDGSMFCGWEMVCIDNVKYLIYCKGGNTSLMSIYINPETLKPENCKANTLQQNPTQEKLHGQ